DRPRWNPKCASLFPLGEDLGRVEGKAGAWTELRHDVVVIGVEPLGHLKRGNLVVAAGGREVAVQFVGDIGDPGRECTDHYGGVEHLVVVRKGVHGNRVQPCGDQFCPAVAAQRRGDAFELVTVDLARPVLFNGTFQFAVGAYARRSQDGGVEVCCGHDY